MLPIVIVLASLVIEILSQATRLFSFTVLRPVIVPKIPVPAPKLFAASNTDVPT